MLTAKQTAFINAYGAIECTSVLEAMKQTGTLSEDLLLWGNEPEFRAAMLSLFLALEPFPLSEADAFDFRPEPPLRLAFSSLGGGFPDLLIDPLLGFGYDFASRTVGHPADMTGGGSLLDVRRVPVSAIDPASIKWFSSLYGWAGVDREVRASGQVAD